VVPVAGAVGCPAAVPKVLLQKERGI